MTAFDPVELAGQVAAVFERLGIRYLLGGSLASTAFGEPRATLAVDFAAELRPEHVEPLVAAFEAEFFADSQWIGDEVRRQGSFQIVHRPTMTRVDVFVPEWTGIHLWKRERRRRIALGDETGTSIDVTSPEGIVIRKPARYRDGGKTSDRRWRDVVGVLKTQRDHLDRGELRARAGRLALSALLARALGQAGLDNS